MKFILNQDKVEVQDVGVVNSGSVQYYEVEVEHDESWNDLTIEAVIVPKEGGTLLFDEAQSIAVIDGKMYIDRELSGSYAIGFKGYTIENELKVYQISTNLIGVYFDIGAGQIITTNEIPKPTEWEIYVRQIEAIAGRASQSAEDAQTSAENAENSAEEAERQAGIATEQAASASTSADTAAEQAGIATQKAEVAATKASEASTSATKAKASEDNAKASETSASSSASSASASAGNAATAASSASSSATSASASAGVASSKASEAASSANSASQSATAAAKSKNDAQDLVDGFNSTVETATNNFNSNATEKTNTFNTNATSKTNAFNDNATSKTNDFNSNATQKTNDFNDNATQKTNEFNGVVDIAKSEIEEIAPEMQKTIDDADTFMNDLTAEGTSIHTEKSAQWHGELDFEGFSRQKSTAGKQLFKTIPSETKNGVTLTNNGDGSYTLNGTATSSANFFINNNTLEAEDYSLQCKHDGSLPNNSSPRVQIYSESNSFALNVSNNANNDSVSTLNLASNATDVSFRIRIENGFTYNNVKLYPMLSKGIYTSETMPEFEEYTGGQAAPSPSYPFEIRNLEGKNKLNIEDISTVYPSNVTYSVENNKLTIEAVNATVGSQSITYTVDGLDENKKYTISFKGKKISGTEKLRCLVRGIQEETSTTLYNIDQTSPVINTEYSKSQVITGYKKYQFLFYNATSNPVTLGEKTEYWDIQLEEGEVATEYVPYNTLRFIQRGKNLLNKDEGCINAYIDSSGNVHTDVSKLNALFNQIIKVKGNQSYTFSSSKTLYKIAISEFRGDTTFIKRTEFSQLYFAAITTDLETVYLRISIIYQNATETTQEIIDTLDLMLEQGSTATDYEAYKETIIDFPLQEGQKMYEDSVLAEHSTDNYRGQIVFDGTEESLVYDSKGNGFIRFRSTCEDMKSGGNNPMLCNYFKQVPSSETETSTRNKECMASGSGANYRIMFVLNETNFPDITTFKNWLAQKYANGTPLILEYELAEPETVSYTSEQQIAYNKLKKLQMYRLVNNIDLIANEETNMRLDYKEDLQTQIKNIESRLTLLE